LIIEHRGKSPNIHESAYIAPNAVINGDVTIGENSRVLFGAVITAEGGPVEIGSNCIIMENAVVRGTKNHPTDIGHHVLVGPTAHVTGCTIFENSFVATGAAIFNGAKIGPGATVRINGIVHVNSVLGEGEFVPINWIAVGNPAKSFPPGAHEEFWPIQREMNFPQTVFGLERAPHGEMMPQMTELYCKGLRAHLRDRIIEK
jgi:carbonic anhydrase/acetyltransferase-like protein (isoleucine patch superfamily)